MTSVPPFSFNTGSTEPSKKPESVFRSGGQTKQYPPRPRITTAKPQAPKRADPPKRETGGERRV